MKLSTKWILIGLVLPLVGIFLGKNVQVNDEIKGRSLKKGSAISTLLCFLTIVFLLLFWIGTKMK